MDKKKIAFIVITAISVAASLIACALGIPYTPADVDYDYLLTESADAAEKECAEEAAAAVHAVTARGVSADTGTD